MSDPDTPPPKTTMSFLSKRVNASITSFNQVVYEYTRFKYSIVTSVDIQKRLVLSLREDGYLKESRPAYIKSMLMCLHAYTAIDKLVTGFNQWTLCGPDERGHYFICRNGILHVSSEGEISKVLLPHTPNFFSKTMFGVNYKKECFAKRFMLFLNEIFPDRDTRLFLQEYMGYCLTHETEHAKLLILFGAGANGKSVLLLILKLLIGKDNYSTLPFDAFYNGNRFLLTKTEGMTANIYEEIPEDRKVKTDVIKNMVTGGEFTAEEKFQSARIVKSTAKFIFACNTLPNFSDKSDGIFRRLVIIPFTKQFLTHEEQDTRLSQESYWHDSEELDGIFAWAIEGLSRLLQRGHFLEPKCSIQTKELYRLEQNQERQFLNDFYQYTDETSDRISSHLLFQKYKNYCENFGLYKSSSIKLGQEVRRTFPMIKQTKNPIMTNERVKSRIWIGMKEKLAQTEQRTSSNEQI